MFEIPENLPLALAPIAWLCGRWQGWGTMSSTSKTQTGEMQNHFLAQDMSADIVGEQLRLRTTIRQGHTDTNIDPATDARTGLSFITPAKLISEETLYLSILPGSGDLPAPGKYEKRAITASGAHTGGYAILWVGTLEGPRFELASDTLIRSAHAPHFSRFIRMYGLVNGELMWAQETTVEGAEKPLDMSGRLARINNHDSE